MVDLRELAESELGEGIARAYRGELERLQALLRAEDDVHVLTMASRYVRTGIFVVTSRGCLFAVKKYFHWYEIGDFPFGPELFLEISRRAGIDLVGFRDEITEPYWLGLNPKIGAGAEPRDPLTLIRQVADLTRMKGGTVTGATSWADSF
jgi:hypothetical protein